MTPSLHLSRPADPQPSDSHDVTVNLRTVEHYKLVMGEDATIDPDL
jgi:hypothetical protein